MGSQEQAMANEQFLQIVSESKRYTFAEICEKLVESGRCEPGLTGILQSIAFLHFNAGRGAQGTKFVDIEIQYSLKGPVYAVKSMHDLALDGPYWRP